MQTTPERQRSRFNPYPQRPARRSPNVQLLAPRQLDNGVVLTAQQEAVLSTTNLNEKIIVIAAAAGQSCLQTLLRISVQRMRSLAFAHACTH
jgi:hypothetical protein